jgi:signal transduction histidine kinase
VLALIVEAVRRVENGRMRLRALAWLVTVGTAGLCAGAITLDRLTTSGAYDRLSPWLVPVAVAAVLVPTFVGLVLQRRMPTHPVPWILMLGGFSLATSFVATPYAAVSLQHPDALPGGRWVAAYDDASWPLFYAWPLALAFLFPDGRLPSRRWRPWAIVAALSFPATMFAIATSGDPMAAPFENVKKPLVLLGGALSAFRLVTWLVMFASLFVGAYAVRTRFRRSTGIERKQLLWLTWTAMLIPVGLGVCVVWGHLIGSAVGTFVLVFLLVMEIAVALAVAVAITRYRLYDIDRVVNRTLVYAALTLVLGGVYAGVSVALGVALGGETAWATAGATLAAAVVFGKARTLVQAGVDRRFARARYDGLRLVRGFEASVRDGRAEPEEVEPILRQALGDPGAELYFRLPESDAYADRYGREVTPSVSAPQTATPVHRQDSEVAILLHDQSLLERPDLLRSILAAATLAIEIARLRVEVRIQLAAVAESRQRIMVAADEERRRLGRDLHDGAQQRLVTLGLQLRRIQRSLPPEARVLSSALDSAVDEVGSAIVDLRTIAAGSRPAELHEGLAVALSEVARRAPIPVQIDIAAAGLPEPLESAAYFVACEAMTNAVKHGAASTIRVRARHEQGELIIEVVDDGVGGAEIGTGSGLIGLADRVESHGGHLTLESPPGGGTAVRAVIPCES